MSINFTSVCVTAMREQVSKMFLKLDFYRAMCGVYKSSFHVVKLFWAWRSREVICKLAVNHCDDLSRALGLGLLGLVKKDTRKWQIFWNEMTIVILSVCVCECCAKQIKNRTEEHLVACKVNHFGGVLWLVHLAGVKFLMKKFPRLSRSFSRPSLIHTHTGPNWSKTK